MKNNNIFLLVIGIIFGVIFIAGGTYAFLTFNNVSLINNVYTNVTTRNFTFTSPTGTIVKSLHPFPHQPIRAGITGGTGGDNGTGYIVLGLSKAANTPKAPSVKLIVKFDTMQVNVADYIKVAVCRSSTASDCDNSLAEAIPSTVNNSNWVVVNKSIANNTSEQVIFEDTASTGTPFNVIGAASTTYYIYFWLNAEVVTNANAASLAASQVVGSVYFVATQG